MLGVGDRWHRREDGRGGKRCCLRLYEQFSLKRNLHKMSSLIHGMLWFIYFIDQLYIILVNELVGIAENRANQGN